MARLRAALGILAVSLLGTGAWWAFGPRARVVPTPAWLVPADAPWFRETNGSDGATAVLRTAGGEIRFRPARSGDEDAIGGYVLEGADPATLAAAVARAENPNIPSLGTDPTWRRIERERDRFSLRAAGNPVLFARWWSEEVRTDTALADLAAPLRDLAAASERIVGAVRGASLTAYLLPETAPAGLLFAEANLATLPFEEALPPGEAIFGASYRPDESRRWGASFAPDRRDFEALFAEGDPIEIARVRRAGTEYALARHDWGTETALSRLARLLPAAAAPAVEGWRIQGYAPRGGGRGAYLDLGGGTLMAIAGPDESSLGAALSAALDPEGGRRLVVHPDFGGARRLLPEKFAAALVWRGAGAPDSHLVTRAIGFTGPEGPERLAVFFSSVRTGN